ncbi:sensor histidine kinase [Polynucleobacter kasalickyi]|uniref:histidine kinase n=1 Tax=Polynucleobacter kasalickyi TaxID=1938817 RepID=A0A1W2B1I2_9BURK|nr:PAS domain S-box protein [Polynucleobacter kasalickyi]SMC66823.1 PAS/PAC sensor signal transduction histidine kinase [Polynucleobacter kasalickyi]
MVAMFTILWTLNNQETRQVEITLFRDVDYSEQRIQVNFDENEEEFLILSKVFNENVSSSTIEFYQRTGDLLSRHTEILQIRAISTDNTSTLKYPINGAADWTTGPVVKNIIQDNYQETLQEALKSGNGQYGHLFSLDSVSSNQAINRNRSLVFWYVQPAQIFSTTNHHIAVLYSMPALLNRIIPKDILSRHRFTVLNENRQPILSLSEKNLAKVHASHQVRLSKFPESIALQAESYPSPSNINYQMLYWLVIGLSAYVIWSFWSIWRHMKSRQDIQKNLIKETNFRRAIEESNPVGLRVHDMDGKINYVNPAFCKMVGWTAEELSGKYPPFPFWSSEEEVSNNMLKLDDAFKNKTGSVKGIEATITAKDGKKIAVRNFVSPMIDARNRQTGWINSLIDISEPQRIREELAISQQRFITVLEGLDAAISVINPKNGELLFTNGLYREMFGNSAKAHMQLIGNESNLINNDLADDDSIDIYAGLPSVMLTPITGDSIEVQLPSHNENWYEVRRRYIPWTDGHLAQLLITTDITLRKQTEENLRKQEEKLQFSSRLTTMGEMASSIAHELNQPLAAINNYCMGVITRVKNYADPTFQSEILPALEKASAQALRAGTIIQRIRNFVKRSAPQRIICRIEDIIQQSIELAEIDSKRYNLEIRSLLPTDLPDCFVDPVLIEQVIVNLLKNAIDSMRSSTPVHLRSMSQPIYLIVDFDKSSPHEMLRIRIVDNGLGINSALIPRIFEPFYSTKTEGMGMGLNICRSVIESHQGRLFVVNNNDEAIQEVNSESYLARESGCTFVVLLPTETIS